MFLAIVVLGGSGNIQNKVFEFVTILHPSFQWKKHVAKTGKSVGREVYNTEMKDACDAYVLCRGGQIIYSGK